MHPMALGEPGAGEYILITDYSKEAMGAIQHRVTRFIGAKGRKCRAYEKNYHSSKGDVLALDYRLKKFRFLHQGPFTVRSDNSTVVHAECRSKGKPMCEKVDGKLFPVQHEAGPNARQIDPHRPLVLAEQPTLSSRVRAQLKC